MSNRVLISGLSGSGKTYLSKFFSGKGKVSIDADVAIGRWVDKKTGKPREPSKEEWRQLSGIEWEWDGKELRRILRQNREVYIFGSAANVHKFLNLFDRIYYLDASKELILRRLRSSARDHDFGRHPIQRKWILSWIKPVAEISRKAGFRFIDASLKPKRIFEIITGENS